MPVTVFKYKNNDINYIQLPLAPNLELGRLLLEAPASTAFITSMTKQELRRPGAQNRKALKALPFCIV